MQPDQQKAYWNERIASWDSSIYDKRRPLPWIERAAAPFRSNLRARKAYALAALARARPASLLELACGTGELYAGLPEGAGLRRYVGVDISAVAVQQARARPERPALAAEFVCSSIRDLDPTAYADFDFVLALGMMPYITDDEFETFARLIRGKRFLFDYHRAGRSLWNLMHACYRSVAGHPFYRMHDDAQMARLLRDGGVLDFGLSHQRGIALVASPGVGAAGS